MKNLLTTLLILAATGAAIGQTTISGNLSVSPTWLHEKTTGQATIRESLSKLVDWDVTYGTNANQMTSLAVNTNTLAATGTQNVSLHGVVNNFGDALTLNRVKFLAFQCDASNTNNMTIGGAPVDPFSAFFADPSDIITVPPGGFVLFTAPQLTGYAVGTTTNILISGTGSGTNTYYLYIGGTQ